MREGRWGSKRRNRSTWTWGTEDERGWEELWERRARERCEGGMKMTQFVLSSCEKREA